MVEIEIWIKFCISFNLVLHEDAVLVILKPILLFLVPAFNRYLCLCWLYKC